MKTSRLSAARSTLFALFALGALGVLPALGGTVGCATGTGIVTSSLTDVDRARTSPGALEGQRLAPQEYARAEQERRLAHNAEDRGDGTAASLHADRALASYQRAFVLARLARATEDQSAARSALDATDEEARRLSRSRADVERETDELERQLKLAKDAVQPVPSGPADPAREAARLVAAESLATYGRLLCAAGRLVAPSFEGLADGEKASEELLATLARSPRPAPIDAAARLRAQCLSLLTRARREVGPQAPSADSLLEELAAAGGWDPTRDERGVVVTLTGAFKGASLEPAAEKKLEELGRVAAAHASFAVQVVVHDAAAPGPHETGAGAGAGESGKGAADTTRGEAAVTALVTGGADRAHVKAENAFARAPLVDPSDARHRGRNARLDVVFVAKGD